MRRKAGTFVLALVVAVVGFVFVFTFQTGRFGGERGENVIAIVNGEKIRSEEYLRELKRTTDLYKSFLGDKFDTQMMRQLDLKRQALDRLITDRLIVQEAKKLNFRVTNKELRKFIESTPIFQTNGTFDSVLYRQLLIANTLSPSQFESAQRRQLLLRGIQSFIQRTTGISYVEVKTNFLIGGDKVNLGFIKIDPDLFVKGVLVSKEEIAKILREKEERVTSLLKEQPSKPAEGGREKIAEKLLREERSRDLAEAIAAQLIQRFEKGEKTEDLLKKYQLSLEETGFFSREFALIPKIGVAPDLSAKAFTLGGPHKAHSFFINDAFYVVFLKERTSPKWNDFEQKKQEKIQEELTRKQAHFGNLWLVFLKDSSKIKTNEKLLATL